MVSGTKIYHRSKSLRNFTGILCEIALTFQVLITVVYWSILHHFVVTVRIPEIRLTDEFLADVVYWFNVFIHSLPLVTAVINTAIS